MKPVLDAQAIREADAYTIAHEPITSLDLMERAATQCTDRIAHWHRSGRFGDPTSTTFVVFAGMGNNGGDGLVIARLLHAQGLAVRVVRVKHRVDPSPDHATNWSRLIESGLEALELTGPDQDPEFRDNDIVIDAMFGTGLRKSLEGWVADLIDGIVRSGRPVVSVDMPSGLFCEDNDGNGPKGIIRAQLTLTFEVPKLAFFLAENDAFVGDPEVVPIGLDAVYIAKAAAHHFVIEERDILAQIRPRPRFAHKGTFGHALLIAGSKGKMGAAILAVRSALKSGVGLVTAHVPGCGHDPVQIAAPEAMCSADIGNNVIERLPVLEQCTAVGIGPGIGMEDATLKVVKQMIQSGVQRLVFDADALNALANNPTWLAFLPKGTILTPHPKEFDRLAGSSSRSGFVRLERAREFAMKNGCVLVLKGARTAVCDPNGTVFFNPTGNPGMAKGGSGDALTGVLTGLLAQGHEPLSAALLGVYLHGVAGDIAARHKGMDGMTAGDIVDALPAAWRHLRNASEETLH